MKVLSVIILSFVGFFNLCSAKVPKRPWQFSQELTHHDPHLAPLETQNQYVYSTAHLHPEKLDQLNHSSVVDRETLQSAVNFSTLIYIVFNVYKTYQEIYVATGTLPSDKDSFLLQTVKGIIIYLCPEFLMSLGQHSKFLITTLAITLTALIYKSIIKLVIITTYSDIFEMMSNRLFGEKKRFGKNYSNAFNRSSDLSLTKSDI